MKHDNSIDPTILTTDELPTDPTTREAILAGNILVDRNDQGELAAYNQISIRFIDRGMPLRHALLTTIEKYPILIDERGMPTEQDRKDSPALYCHAAMCTGQNGRLTPDSAAKSLLLVLTNQMERGLVMPTLSAALQNAITTMQETLNVCQLTHDRRIREPLTALVAQVEAEQFPLTYEAIQAKIKDSQEQRFYYWLKDPIYRAHVLLHWYEVPTLYIMRTTSGDSSVGTRYTALNSNRERAEMEFANIWASNHNTSDTERWELLANDTILRSLTRDEKDDALYDLSVEWDHRTDDEISYWLQ